MRSLIGCITTSSDPGTGNWEAGNWGQGRDRELGTGNWSLEMGNWGQGAGNWGQGTGGGKWEHQKLGGRLCSPSTVIQFDDHPMCREEHKKSSVPIFVGKLHPLAISKAHGTMCCNIFFCTTSFGLRKVLSFRNQTVLMMQHCCCCCSTVFPHAG